MYGIKLKTLLAFLLLIGVGHAGLVQRYARKETLTSPTLLDKDNKIALSPPRIDQIPVAIITEPEGELTIHATEAEAGREPELTIVPLEISPPQTLLTTAADIELSENDAKKVKKIEPIDTVVPAVIKESLEMPSSTGISQQQSKTEAQQIAETSPKLQVNEEQSKLIISSETPAPLELANNLKALASPGNVVMDQQTPELIDPELASPDISVPLQEDLQRQVTQATPTQTSTPQNFVQQLIQNSPIGQFLSQFTGGQQQQQQGQVQADEPATPAPTLPGFLSPGAAITSAQQAVQSVVNTTTQAFQGLQQFATNLGTQFQNTFSTLSGQQNQLSTADSTTTRPPGPIQSIVSNFVNPGSNQGSESSTAAPGQQQQQGPLQGIISFFQGGNRPQQAANAIPTTSAPPKEETSTQSGVDDKIETEQQQDAAAQDQKEPDTDNEVRNSDEVINEETSFEEGQGEDLIVVNDDATQHDVTI